MILRLLLTVFGLLLIVAAHDRTDGDIVDLMKLLSASSDDHKLLQELLENENLRRSDRLEKLNEILLRQTREIQEVYDMKMTYEDEVEYMRKQENENRKMTASAAERKYMEEMAKLKNDMTITVAEFKEHKKRLQKFFLKDSKKNEN